ncbi:MAG: DUF6527 family protein [Hylemonella sp.]|uniref:DUF6527 family protein n=1 Tax=Hylemonella sp. TaxID=2066020 RepID=UPI00391B766A
MSAISKVLRQAGNNGYRMLLFWCPGCNEAHGVSVARPAGQPGPVWGYNENPNKPTFTPSVLVRTGRAVDPAFVPEPGDPPEVCHSFVTNGRIQFLNDCTHGLAGQTVDLPEKWEPGA